MVTFSRVPSRRIIFVASEMTLPSTVNPLAAVAICTFVPLLVVKIIPVSIPANAESNVIAVSVLIVTEVTSEISVSELSF